VGTGAINTRSAAVLEGGEEDKERGGGGEGEGGCRSERGGGFMTGAGAVGG